MDKQVNDMENVCFSILYFRIQQRVSQLNPKICFMSIISFLCSGKTLERCHRKPLIQAISFLQALYKQLGQIKELESQFKREKLIYKEDLEVTMNILLKIHETCSFPLKLACKLRKSAKMSQKSSGLFFKNDIFDMG